MKTHSSNCEEELKEAMALLLEASGEFVDNETAPNPTWWKRYFLLDGAHMILTDEGWEPGDAKPAYEAQAKEEMWPLSDYIRDEVNAP